MNILTIDIISVIANRVFSVIKITLLCITIYYKDQNDKFHRINGPALVSYQNDWKWYFHGYAHRTDYTKPTTKINNYYTWRNMGKFVTHSKK